MVQFNPHKLGIDRILEDQQIRIADFAKQSAGWRRRDRILRQNPGAPSTFISNQSVSTHAQVENPYPGLTKFIFYLSLVSMIAGSAIGYLFSSRLLTGWWQLAGTTFGAIVGFASPWLSVMVLAGLLYVLVSLILGLLDFLWFGLQILLAAAAVVGLIFLIEHYSS